MKIKLVPNPRKKWANDVACKIKNLLLKRGHGVVYTNADVTICIGGDGSILFTNHMGDLQGAVLGIGTHTSAICQLTKNNWKKHIIKYIEKNGREQRYLLEAQASRKKFSALNDFVVHTKDYRVLKINLNIDGKEHVFEGDGIIIATATGSMAYAYSAGGKKLPSGSKRMSVVPIAPYKRLFKPVILPGTAKISISCDRESAFIVDGIFIRNLRPKEKVRFSQTGNLYFISKVV